MKILYVANRAEVFSGGQISFLELLSRVDMASFHPLVLCPGEGPLINKIRKMGLDSYVWDMPSARTPNIFKIKSVIDQLRGIILKSGADIVHTNGSRAQLYSSFAIKGTGCKLLWHVRETKRDIPFYDRHLEKASEKILCVSRAVVRERFPYLSNDDKARVIYNGVDTTRFFNNSEERTRVRKELGLNDGDRLIGVLALIERLKGHHLLLRAMSSIKDKYPNVKLVFAGRAVDERYLNFLKKTAVNLGMGGRVIFPGENSDVRGFLSALDIFVLPSRREGFSRVLLEAMACSSPIIATDVGGNSEAIVDGETGYLVPYGDEGMLTSALEIFLSDASRAKAMGDAARERVQQEFSLEKHVSDVQNLYQEMAGDRNKE